MNIKRVSSGGIIANYRCSAACVHCMYGSSPNAEPGYITEQDAVKICASLYKLGCRGLHIGGGEPFLNAGGLVTLIKAIRKSGIALDYIETNASWITGDDKRDGDILSSVMNAGGNVIMVSADPFHVAFIPFWKPKRLIRMLGESGADYFVWQDRFVPLLSKLDEQRTYGADELEVVFDYDVIVKSANEYGMGFNGRALNILRRASKERKRAGEFMDVTPCSGLSRTSHFHADLFGNYIAPGCTGIGMPVGEVDKKVNAGKYPALSALCERGTAGLFAYALKRGYKEPIEGYVSKCDVCFQIRKYLHSTEPAIHPELSPHSYYESDF